jgi:parallel beta-helix repeat protein
LNDSAIDLTVDDIDIGTPRPNTDFTVNATIKNWGSEDTDGHFNVSLHVDGVLNGTVNVTSGLSGGGSTTVSFEDVNLLKGCHEFKVFADCDSDITDESITTNNNKTVDGQVGYVIVVECDDDFEELNTSGDCALPSGCFKNVSGTYYIQNLTGSYTIENCNGNGITIRNTDATFVINNCTIENCTGSGVFFHDLKNGTINGSTIQNNTKYGVEVGLVPLDSNDPEFVDITNNTIEENLYGIELIGFNCTVKDNEAISNSTEYGIYLLANDTDITYNTIRDNGNYGIKAYNSYNNDIDHNNFIDNTVPAGGTHQAWDNKTSNDWNTTTTGNYWDDCGPFCQIVGYNIDGGAGQKDEQPNGSQF